MLKTKWLMEIKDVDSNVKGKLSYLKEREHNHHSEEFKEQFHENRFLNEIGTCVIPMGNRSDLQHYTYYCTNLYSRTKRGQKEKSLGQLQVSLSDPDKEIF